MKTLLLPKTPNIRLHAQLTKKTNIEVLVEHEGITDARSTDGPHAETARVLFKSERWSVALNLVILRVEMIIFLLVNNQYI